MQCLHQVAKLVMRAFAYKMRRTARDRAGWTEMTKQRALPGYIVLVSGHFSLSFPLVVRLFCRKLSRSTERNFARPGRFLFWSCPLRMRSCSALFEQSKMAVA